MGKAERRQQILESAARLFAARRFDEVLMDEIAHEAGVAKGTLYSYFPDKEELYFAVVHEGISRLNERLEALVDNQMPPAARLREIMHAIVSFLHHNHFFFRLMSMEDAKAEAGRRRWWEERRRQMNLIEAVLRDGQTAGVFRLQSLTAEAQILRGMVRSVLHCHEQHLSVEEMVEIIMRVFLHGVQVAAAEPTSPSASADGG